MSDDLIRRTYTVPFISGHPLFIDYLFDHHHFRFNDFYTGSAKAAVDDCGYCANDIVYKWALRDADVTFEIVDDSAVLYGMINGENQIVARLDNLTRDDVKYLSKAEKKLTLTGGMGKKILLNDETGRYRYDREQFYPWTFVIHGVARLVRK